MSVSVALTEDQRSLLQLSLEIARDKFRENVRELEPKSNKVIRSLSEQFLEQANEAEQLLMWVANADNVIIEEARD
jgi:hypothetical protein